jgi:hypothetical protein
MRYWVFHEEMLDKMLAAREAARQKAGATEQQAKDDTAVIKLFLIEAEGLQGYEMGTARPPHGGIG